MPSFALSRPECPEFRNITVRRDIQKHCALFTLQTYSANSIAVALYTYLAHRTSFTESF